MTYNRESVLLERKHLVDPPPRSVAFIYIKWPSFEKWEIREYGVPEEKDCGGICNIRVFENSKDVWTAFLEDYEGLFERDNPSLAENYWKLREGEKGFRGNSY